MSSSSGPAMPSESPQRPNTDRILTAWINHSERVISFHPVPGYLRLPARDADGFWAKIRALVESGYRLQ